MITFIISYSFLVYWIFKLGAWNMLLNDQFTHRDAKICRESKTIEHNRFIMWIGGLYLVKSATLKST